MSKLRYSLYCDESGTNGGECFYFGGIHCSPARAEILEAQVKSYRARTSFTEEFKWNKISKKTLPLYVDFVDIFGSPQISGGNRLNF